MGIGLELAPHSVETDGEQDQYFTDLAPGFAAYAFARTLFDTIRLVEPPI